MALSQRLASCLLVFALAGCGKPEKGAVRELNEIPVEQLRVVLKGFPGDWRADSDQSKGIAEPPAVKPAPPGATRMELAPASGLPVLGSQALGDAIASRASARTFSPEPLGLDELAYLLWATQGVTRTSQDDAGNPLHFRAAPSGGGRYPLETYLAVLRVEGLAPGLYRYLPVEHRLVLVREAPEIAQELQQACYGQTFPGEAAVAFLWTAIPYRTEWRYAYLAPRMIAIEAGHVCQNLYLAAGSIQAGACALLSYHQPALDALLGVDGKEEFAIYLACVGKVKAP